VLTGGSGSDIFEVPLGAGDFTLITDYAHGDDRIYISGTSQIEYSTERIITKYSYLENVFYDGRDGRLLLYYVYDLITAEYGELKGAVVLSGWDGPLTGRRKLNALALAPLEIIDDLPLEPPGVDTGYKSFYIFQHNHLKLSQVPENKDAIESIHHRSILHRIHSWKSHRKNLVASQQF